MKSKKENKNKSYRIIKFYKFGVGNLDTKFLLLIIIGVKNNDKRK